MKNKQKLIDKIAKLKAQLEPLQKELDLIYVEEGKETEEKVEACYNKTDKFELSELRFARHTLCECRLGMAYPLNSNVRGAWHCSGILLGTADEKVKHSGSMPFAFYEVKSENETQTTRPAPCT